ncbi:CCR4-NOT core DEDD RNase subunit [Coemansia sp. RSA 989]|nr:CCR4-NOT transcription complex, subunit 8 [Coemansia mojavensis]KAJ1743738.1 CCR4-NOT core DEDD RNase subunit [Coemansia sp. RSA 1086]KAJ1752588.1 CCR4-NOT core DEDD RNase subunit [Coemansia sp. RSA 1821]KAJ1867154.1 CCR4-NOT core DEDD RNase subunit [Coemansia sp. RSA 989]KAJ1874031.1 CCR4-NOT core DEDD RNase subunit [Coemansia sp. RSA 990]KAJ2628627.1 CCR4-NOT core DEDD RNase subunit [Coemansia sp. RSA 1290]KAJ2649049.1 CCR4-NOT core DEDD RNase subunit [Coemansia sp. RSA 1250]KAJ2671742.
MSDTGTYLIRDVWESNLEEEFALIRKLIDKYNYISMDTEFPGVVARPIGTFSCTSDYHYQLLRCNVDLLNIIQLGITLMDSAGNPPPGVCSWQFNFKFSLASDMYAQESIDLLSKSGIDFRKNEEFGIDAFHFGELLTDSGLVLFKNVRWVSFHSGYDFGYLLKLLTCDALPEEEGGFFQKLHTFFPGIFDIKYMMRSCRMLKGGLQDVADDLEVPRIGPQHQAGSDSLLTAMTFFKLREKYFENYVDEPKYLGHLFGLGSQLFQSSQQAATSSTSNTAVGA